MYIRIPPKHLWGAVLKRATEVVEKLPGSHHGGGAKVNQSNVETFVDDDVLVFDVPVKDALRPQIEDCGHQLGAERMKVSPFRAHSSAFISLATLRVYATHTCLKT